MSKPGSRTTSSLVTPLALEERTPEGELWVRIRQREAAGRIGLSALLGVELSDLLEEAVRTVADVLSVEYVEVLELLPGGDLLLLRAGVGWMEGLVGRVTVGTGLKSQAGYALMSQGVVVVEDLEIEDRFETPPLLRDHRVVSGLSATIHAGSGVHGVLGAHTSWKRPFSEDEVLFLQEVADVLGAAVEREKAESLLGERTKWAEDAERRFTFLAEANEVLCASTDLSTVLATAARLAVPALADWCFVDIIESGGVVGRLGVTRADFDRDSAASRSRYQLHPNATHGTPRILRTGGLELIPEVSGGFLEEIACDADLLEPALHSNPGSFICVPLRVGGRTLGAMGMVSLTSGRRYGKEDLALATGLAHCAALAIDNARHHLSETELTRELLRRADRGKTLISPTRHENAPSLTPRQTEVLQKLAAGYSAREIGHEFYLSEATVRNHIRALLLAFGAHSQLEVLARARESGVLP